MQLRISSHSLALHILALQLLHLHLELLDFRVVVKAKAMFAVRMFAQASRLALGANVLVMHTVTYETITRRCEAAWLRRSS